MNISATRRSQNGTAGTHSGGLATNLHALGADDKTIQAILRHSNVGLTMNVYVKSLSESQVSALDTLNEKFLGLEGTQKQRSKNGELCNVRTTSDDGPIK